MGRFQLGARGPGLQSQLQTLHALQQGVVQVAGNALAFVDADVHLPPQSLQAEDIGDPQQDRQQQQAQGAKPPGLVVGRRARQCQRRGDRAGGIAGANGAHLKNVMARGHVGEDRFAACIDILPVAEPLQSIGKLHAFRMRQRRCGVGNAKRALFRRKPDAFVPYPVSRLVAAHGFHHHRRQPRACREMGRIDPCQTGDGVGPYPSIGGKT